MKCISLYVLLYVEVCFYPRTEAIFKKHSGWDHYLSPELHGFESSIDRYKAAGQQSLEKWGTFSQ